MYSKEQCKHCSGGRCPHCKWTGFQSQCICPICGTAVIYCDTSWVCPRCCTTSSNNLDWWSDGTLVIRKNQYWQAVRESCVGYGSTPNEAVTNLRVELNHVRN